MEPRLVPCGEQLCPAGLTCVADELCASTDQIDACAGHADQDTCTVQGAVGRCDRGVCIPAGCGNAIIDADEACDDGNQIDGDGCRGDCRKVEVCGDQVVDDGEGCDDANDNDADGCDACMQTLWQATAIIGGNANARTTELTNPQAIALDRHGNLYMAEAEEHRVRRLDTRSGILTTIAGTRNSGFSGDGGPATSATLNTPRGVAVDGLGNVYIADHNNHRIRRVSPTGIITTIAGTGVAGYSGDGALATAAQLRTPMGLAVDGLGTLYFSDRGNHRVRRIDVTGIITTIAGNGVAGYAGDGGDASNAQLNGPAMLALDAQSNVYVADELNHAVRRIATNGIITTLAGTGTAGFGGDGALATSAQLNRPTTVGVDAVGNLFISDSNNNRVRTIDSTGIMTTVAGTGSFGFNGDGMATTVQLSFPMGIVADEAGRFYIADTFNQRIRLLDTTGMLTTIAGNGIEGYTEGGDGGAATSAQSSVTGVAVDTAGNVYVSSASHCIRRIDQRGVITKIAGNGNRFVPNFGGVGFGGDGGPAINALFNNPTDVEPDAAGGLYIADRGNSRIRYIDASGVITTIAGTGVAGFAGDGGPATSANLNRALDVALSGSYVYIADTSNHVVRRIDAAGVITTVAGTGAAGFSGDGGPASAAQLNFPQGIAVDAVGTLYIVDTFNHRIRRVDGSGTITTVAGTGTLGFSGDGGPATSAQLWFPAGATFDAAGNLFIADFTNRRVRRIDGTGVITTVAGSSPGFGGDGGPATSAMLATTPRLAFDSAGNLYIADAGNRAIRRVDTAGVMTTIASGVGGMEGTSIKWFGVDPRGMGPIAQARLADPRAFVLAPSFTLFAGGNSGTIQAARLETDWLEVVAGRYPNPTSTGALARFRDASFGTVSGIAYDAPRIACDAERRIDRERRRRHTFAR